MQPAAQTTAHEYLITQTPDAQDLPLPRRHSPGASGLDLYANVQQPVVLRPMHRELIPTGIRIALPMGTEAQIRSRSGLALRHGVVLAGGVGTVDCDYRGQIHALLINLGDADFVIHRADRIAQMVVAHVQMADFVQAADLPPSLRGADGFGSTGVKST